MTRSTPASRWRSALVASVLLAGCASIQLGGPLGEPSTDPPGLPIEQAWERDVGAAFGPGAPIVTGKYVVVGTRRGEVVVLDGTDGSVEGVGEIGESVEGAVAMSEGGRMLFAGTAEARGGVRAIDVRTGRRVWDWREGGVVGGVVRVGEVVVTATLTGLVAGLDIQTGEMRWGREGRDGVQVHAAPAVDGDGVIVADDRGRLVRYAAATSAESWIAEIGEPVYAAPVVSDGALYVSTTRGTLVRFDAATGAEVWRIASDPSVRLSPAAPRGDALAIGGTDGVVRVLDAATGAERWRWTADGNVTAPPLWLGDHVAVGTHDERLVLLDAATGDPVWSTVVRGRVKSAMATGDNRLIVLSEPRHVVAFQSAP